MRAFLRQAEAIGDCYHPNPELQEWVNQVREVAYDTEDVVDEFVLHFGHHRTNGFYGRVQKIYISIKALRARHRACSRIKDIKYRVESISARHQRYKMDYSIAESGSSNTVAGEDEDYDIRGYALFLDEADLVGIHEPKHELISHIVNDESPLKVVSVLGMGGLGKTTLVKRVYEDGFVSRKFSTHVWATVSQKFHIKEFFKNLVQQLYNEIQEQIPPEIGMLDGYGLRAFVKDFLKAKRFIIVFDDVWGMDSWNAIKCALPRESCGSCVVLTTRIADVASTASKEYRGHVYRVKPLAVEDSWLLFCRKTFEDNCCPPHLERVSRDILSKCGGLPLAVVAIGGLLALKERSKLDEWEMVQRCLGGELEGTGKLNKVKRILLLSYSDLPYYLKICLLYTSIFPEDYRIVGRLLVRMWIAEGFIQERKGMTSVEVAESYLNELVNRNLIQVETSVLGKAGRCGIHDLLREIVLSKSEELNITTVVTERYTKSQNNARRLSIHDFVDNPGERFESKHLRSLFVFGSRNPFTSSSLSELLRDCAKQVKVLHIRDTELKIIPKEVFKLSHLKYLGLKGNPIKVIPGAIGKLHSLEFLSLSRTKVTKLPVDILKLGKLRELYVFQIGNYSENYAVRGFEAPYEIGRLVSLQCLHHIDATNEKVVREIGKLTQLTDLSITKLRSKDGRELCSSLEKLSNLRELCMASVNEDEVLDLQHFGSPTPRFLQLLILKGPLAMLPPWVASLQGLNQLSLLDSRLPEDPLKSLQDLPNLVNLLLHNAYEGGTLRLKAGGFLKLKRLELEKLKYLRWIMAEEGTMPHLEELAITNCKSLEEPPQGIQNLHRLQILGLNDMSNTLTSTLQDQESYYYRNVAHIRHVLLGNWADGKWESRYL